MEYISRNIQEARNQIPWTYAFAVCSPRILWKIWHDFYIHSVNNLAHWTNITLVWVTVSLCDICVDCVIWWTPSHPPSYSLFVQYLSSQFLIRIDFRETIIWRPQRWDGRISTKPWILRPWIKFSYISMPWMWREAAIEFLVPVLRSIKCMHTYI
jgi:hypothetical protein